MAQVLRFEYLMLRVSGTDVSSAIDESPSSGARAFDLRTVLSRLLVVSGLALLAFWALARVHAVAGSAAAMAAFAEEPRAVGDAPDAALPMDTSLWSDTRIAAFREAIGLAVEPPIGILRVKRVALEAPVFRGTDDVTLNRGVGWIPGTADPGTAGNAGIAGHRDGFFRALKDVRVDDVIELETSAGTMTYVIRSLAVVTPDRVDVLQPTSEESLTLVTCHPFYFVGSAPERFIVHATRATEGPEGESATDSSSKQETADRSGPPNGRNVH